MAVDGSHPGCFVHATRLYAVPSDSGFDVDSTRDSYLRASVSRDRHLRSHLSQGVLLGGLAGGLFLTVAARFGARVDQPAALILLFVFGFAVGVAAGIGIRLQQPDLPPRVEGERLPAVEVPVEIAGRAPADATADELVLWSLLLRRLRAARVAVDEIPFAQDAPAAATTTGTVSTAGVGALAELSYLTARNDFAPVAELLGLPLPD
ncbi:hypothetical protein AS850_07360 [Frondihabitans sp. 762G35]|uniref:hypothetical protein n=1 Tax=Frondihabitans sp. 762G35 TaxID=1446794 RepID=UPI000D2258DD|nr:hypothetical protein [Frondihabitans sp. 762G35]ARC56893.1 hypothetical protein AS850_07360 [Frondihabitans sp. 762G35]